MSMSVSSSGSFPYINYSAFASRISTSSSDNSSEDTSVAKKTSTASTTETSTSASKSTDSSETNASASSSVDTEGSATDAKLEKIKKEIAKSAILPSSEKIAEKYGITLDQAAKILSEVCLEQSTKAGGSSEQIAKTAAEMYLVAEMSDNEVADLLDLRELEKKLAAQKEEEARKKEEAKSAGDKESSESQESGDYAKLPSKFSAEQIADMYDLTLEQAQEVLNEVENGDDDSSSSGTTTSAEGDLGSAVNVVFGNADLLGQSTVCFAV